ncbi:MAG: VWA domain-containing protein [Saprospirales bacterium]|nr:VWA domain-containing protein [Saprospirales bacterium]
MTFAEPLWLLLLLLLLWLIYRYRRAAGQRHVSLQVSRQAAMKGVKTWVVYARSWLQALRWMVLVLLIAAMARPQLLWYEEQTEAEAMDILLVLDISPSMLTKDFSPDRLSVAKKVANDFVARRPFDRLGLVAFSGGAFTQCPLTNDRRLLQGFINNLQVGKLQDGTAIGMGIATAVHHLKDSPSPGKVVLLLTDGEHNTGPIGPIQAAEIARALGVRVYPVGIGKDGLVLSPSRQNYDGTYTFAQRQMQFDSTVLTNVARLTNGRFYRAYSANDLRAIYAEIDQLEKAKITINKLEQKTELFFWLLDAAFCLLALELFLRWGPLRVITV